MGGSSKSSQSLDRRSHGSGFLPRKTTAVAWRFSMILISVSCCFDRPVGNPDSGRLQGCEATWRVLSLSFALDHGLMNSLPCVSRYQWRMEGFAVFHGWPSLAHSRVNVFFG